MDSFNEEKFKNNLKWQMQIKLESDITNFWIKQTMKLKRKVHLKIKLS